MSMLDSNSINMSGYAIQELSVGQKASFSKTILASDIYNFAGIIGDFNPVHVNAEYAKNHSVRKPDCSRYVNRLLYIYRIGHGASWSGCYFPGAESQIYSASSCRRYDYSNG